MAAQLFPRTLPAGSLFLLVAYHAGWRAWISISRDCKVMNILLLNAGSSSLKATLMQAADGAVVARGLADWAGSTTRYEYAGPDNKERSEEAPWKGHAEAVRRFVSDLMHAEPIALPER